MKLSEIYDLLESLGLPLAYVRFRESEHPTMPYLLYQETGSHNFSADNKVWHRATKITITLMSAKKDLDTEECIETLLDQHDIFWERSTDYDSGNDCHVTSYDIEV